MIPIGAARRRRRWRPPPRALGCGVLFLLATACIVLVVVRGATRGHRSRVSPPPPVATADRALPEPSAACLAHDGHDAELACPFEPTTPTAGAIDWARGFERGHRCVSAGTLAVASGRIVATDPLVTPEHAPLDVAVPPGTHPVILALSEDPETEGTIALAMLRIAEARPVSWSTPAHATYGVDAGTGCFADAETMARLVAIEEAATSHATSEASRRVDPSRAEAWHAEVQRIREQTPDLFDVLEARGFYRSRAASVCVDAARGANLVVFQSGLGDGVYTTYVGRDADGAIVALVTDFRVVDLGAGRHPFLE